MATLGVSPIKSLDEDRFRVVIQPEAPPAGVHGGSADPKHGQVGEVAEPYPWIEFTGPHGPYGPGEDGMLSEGPEDRTLPAGNIQQDPSGDQAPYYTHGGPNVRGIYNHQPQGQAARLIASYEAHSVQTNSGKKARASSNPAEDPWEFFYNAVPGDDELPAVPGQVGNQAGGFGANDHRSNAYAKVNSYGLATSHRYRRFSTNKVPGNWMWMEPGGRPLHKTLAGPARPPIGEGPFLGQDMGYGFGPEGAILAGPATEYVAPPQPRVVPVTQADESSPEVDLW